MPERLVVLFNNVRALTEVLGKAGNNKIFLQYLDEIKNGSVGAKDAIEKIQASKAFEAKQLDVRIQVREVRIGGILAPIWNKIKEEYLNFLDIFTPFVKATWLKAMGEAGFEDAFKDFQEKLERLSPGMRVFFDILGTSFTIAQNVFQKLYSLITQVIDEAGKIKEALDVLFGFDVLIGVFSAVSSGWIILIDVFSKSINFVSGLIKDIILYVSRLISSFSSEKPKETFSVWGSMLNIIWDTVKQIFILIKNIVEWIAKAVLFVAELEKQYGLLTTILKIVVAIILAPITIISTIIGLVLKLINAWLEFEKRGIGVSTVFIGIYRLISLIVWSIMNPGEAIKEIWNTITSLFVVATDKIVRFFSTFKKYWTDFVNWIKFWKKDTPIIDTKHIGNRIIDGIPQEIEENKPKKIIDKTKENNKKIEDEVKKVNETITKDIEKIKDGQVEYEKEQNKEKIENEKKLVIDVKKIEKEAVENTIKINKETEEKILNIKKEVSENKIEIVKTEAEKMREIQFQKEEAEIKEISRMSAYFESNFKRRTKIVAKEIEEQKKILEKAKDAEIDILKRKADAEESFEEKKAKIISAPLTQTGKDIQQRGLANLYENKMAQALGQNNFREAHSLAKKVQDIYASLAEKAENPLKKQDFQKFLGSQETIMRVFDLEKKANDEAISGATNKITDLSAEIKNLFADFQKELSIKVSTDEANSKIDELRNKFIEARKDLALFLPGGEEFQYEANPKLNLFQTEEAKQKAETKTKPEKTQEETNKILNKILEENKKQNEIKKESASNRKSFQQDNIGNFVQNTVKAQ